MSQYTSEGTTISGLNPGEYLIFGMGTFKDILHPEADIYFVGKREIEVSGGFLGLQGGIYPCLDVMGSVPGAFLRSRRHHFNVAILAKDDESREDLEAKLDKLEWFLRIRKQ